MSRVIVSTDDVEIGAVAKGYGAVVILITGAFYFPRMKKTFADVAK